MKYDAVLSFHMNALGCGVAKFNHRLAKELGVPCEPLWLGFTCLHPLTSIKASEIGAHWLERVPHRGDLLLHDRPADVPSDRRVFFADEIGCPSIIDGNPTRGTFRVLVYGMAGKIQYGHFEALKTRLDHEHDDYTIELSCGIHEGHPWAEGFEESTSAMRAIFGDRLRVLGFLMDDALARTLQEVDAVAAYFTPALRRNNTTYWTALTAGKTVFTNRDELSPSDRDIPTWHGLIARLQPVGASLMTR